MEVPCGMVKIDLHTHSTASDGTLMPEELVRRAKNHGVAVLSLTDHDTTLGLAAFLRACKKYNVRGVTGVELSAEAPFTLHILGYRFDPSCSFLEGALQDLRAQRDVRNRRICEVLQKLGMDVSLEEVEREAGGEVVARPHIARVLIRKGYAQDMRSSFGRFLGRGAPAYVPREKFSPESCIAMIQKCNGVAVLAHPGQTGLPEDQFERLLRDLTDLGLWGLECVSPHHTAREMYDFMRLAAKYGLFVTAGSDFHGANRPGVSLGVTVEDALLPWARLGIVM